MNINLPSLAFSILLCYVGLQEVAAQHLPDRFWISNDGRRLITGNKPSTGFYDETAVKTVELQFSQSDYWQQMTNNYALKLNILGTLIYDGKTYPNVGVRFRGNTSYKNVPGEKKSFSITMDQVDTTQDLKGYETLHFNNAAQDASFMREVLYLHFNRRHIPAAKANFIHLKINGQSWGQYPNIQVLNGEFMNEWFLSNEGTRWRAERTTPGTGGAGGFGAGTSSLNYLGAATSMYEPHYTLKKANKANPWTDLVTACAALNNPVENDLKKVFDTDRALWFVAHEIMFGDDDSYVNKGGMDYYVFWDKETNRIVPIEYDGNSAFNSTASSWSPFLKETDTKFPIMNKLFAVPALRQRYLAHVRTMVEEDLDPAFFNAKIDELHSSIDSLVNADPKKSTTYAQFTAQKAALKSWLTNRRAFYLNNTEVNRQYPTISSVIHKFNNVDLAQPQAGQPVVVTSKITSTTGISQVNLYYGKGFDGYFDKTTMFDDGAHNDGAANDGTFSGSIPGFNKGEYVRYYIEAVANDAPKTVSYMPKGAEHDVYFYQVSLGQSAISSVAINEVMADNKKTQTDANGQFDDWVELFNKTNATVDLTGWFLTDDLNNKDKYKFPAGTTIPANSYLIVWTDEDGSQSGLHANFKLSASGENLILLDKDTAIVDQVTFGSQRTDVSTRESQMVRVLFLF